MIYNYVFDQEYLEITTNQRIQNLAKNKPDADFVEFASGIIYNRLKKNIQHYRAYGPYWWPLKAILKAQGYNVGDDIDLTLAEAYQGANTAETIVAADLFYEDMSNKVLADNNRWTLINEEDDYIIYDEDMESRQDVEELIV
ncbi:MAG: hypothetical protein Q4P13_05800 [Psychrobacter sp.]|nr:hypothetical protein [Psychrobacter sp.]